jgi:hypothetical protein
MKQHIPVDVLVKTIAMRMLPYEQHAYHYRAPNAEIPAFNLERWHLYGPLTDDTDDIYGHLGREVTWRLYRVMSDAIATFLGESKELLLSASLDFANVQRAFLNEGTFELYLLAQSRAIDAGLNTVCFLILKHVAPDFDPEAALQVRLGVATDPTPVLVSEVDKAIERCEPEAAKRFAKDAGINVPTVVNHRSAGICQVGEIVTRRDWWEAHDLPAYFNSAVRKDSKKRKKEEKPEEERAAIELRGRGWRVSSLNDQEEGVSYDTVPTQIQDRASWMLKEYSDDLLASFEKYLRPDARVYLNLKREGLGLRAILDRTGWSEKRLTAATKAYKRAEGRASVILRERPLKSMPRVIPGIFKEYLDSNRSPNTGWPWIYSLDTATVPDIEIMKKN